MVIAGTATTEWRICVISLPSLDTRWMEAMPSMPLCARTSPFRCLPVWMTYMSLPCCAPASSAFAAYVLRKGGVVAINAIHLDHMPVFDYDKLLWGERQIRSVANMTRQDARDFRSEERRVGKECRSRW